MADRTCFYCGGRIHRRHPLAIYCSSSCKGWAWPARVKQANRRSAEAESVKEAA